MINVESLYLQKLLDELAHLELAIDGFFPYLLQNYKYYHIWHLVSGFISEPFSHLNTSANCSVFFNGTVALFHEGYDEANKKHILN